MNTLTQIREKGLTGTALKLLALFFMVLDHIHYFFSAALPVPEWFSMLGRLAAPVFLFCVAEGFAHTHDRKRYFGRIWLISAGMGLIQYGMITTGYLVRPDGFYPQNAIFMNFVILLVIWQGMDWLREKKWAGGILCVALPLAWPILAMFALPVVPSAAGVASLLAYTVLPAWSVIIDGGLPYILLGIILYGFREKRGMQMFLFAVGEFLLFFLLPFLQLRTMPGFSLSWMFTKAYEWYGIFDVFLLWCYNGKRGAGMKHFFYVFYVVHVYGLYALSWLFF